MKAERTENPHGQVGGWWMVHVPAQMLDKLSSSDGEKARAWWAGLSDENKARVADLYDGRREQCFFGVIDDNSAARVPRVIGGRFVANEDTTGWPAWHEELFDHLICNPELLVFAPPVVRTFHICTRHEAARAVLAAGRIPSDFRCPFGENDCPMRSILSLAPGQALQLMDLGIVKSSISTGSAQG
jgi:hypothetical protein